MSDSGDGGSVDPVVDLVPGARMIRANNPSHMTLDGTRTFILGATRPLVIDPGPDDESHLQRLQSLLGGASPVAILLTHAHSDHAGGAAALADRTGAPILMGRGARRAPFDVHRRARFVAEGDRVDCDIGPVSVHETPGHTPEHLVFVYHAEHGERVMFAGDLFLGAGDTTVVSYPDGNVADYLQSLEVVRRIHPDLILPAHGPPLRWARQVVARYRAHRMERIEQVRRAWASHPHLGPEELVESVYGSALDPALRPAAIGSIRAIQEYLRSGAGQGQGNGSGADGVELC